MTQQLTVADVEAALADGSLIKMGKVARDLAEQDATNLDAVTRLIDANNAPGFIMGLFDGGKPTQQGLTSAQYQAALDVLDALLRNGTDINIYIEDRPLDSELNFHTILGWATLDYNVPAARALLSRGARPELSRAEAFYNLLWHHSSYDWQAARIAVLLFQAGLDPGLARPSQLQALFGTPEHEDEDLWRGLSVMLLALPRSVRHRLPGLIYLPVLDEAEEMLGRLVSRDLLQYLLAAM